MAQVSMTGKEFEELLQVKVRYEELMFLMIGARFPKVSEEETEDRWSIQKTGSFREEYPKWLLEAIKYAIANYVNGLSEGQFKNLVKQDWHYYSAHSGEFYGYECDGTVVDILEDPSIAARWYYVKKEECEDGTEQ